MDFELSAEQARLQAAVRAYADERLAPGLFGSPAIDRVLGPIG